LEQYQDAINDYNIALEINPKSIPVIFSRAVVKNLAKDFDGSIKDYDMVIELDSQYAFAYYNRGIIKIDLGQKKDGCSDLRRANELGDESAKAAILKFCK